jgi:hypothetical protein
MTMRKLGLMAGASLLVLAACGQNRSEQRASQAEGGNQPAAAAMAAAPVTAEPAAEAAIAGNPDRNAYFGDVHVHTSLSFDAFTNGTRTTPKDAYDWAQGQTITSSGKGEPMRIRTPLDFYMVADHAEMLGVFKQMADPDSPMSKLPIAKEVLSPDANVAMQAFAGILRDLSTGQADPAFSDPKVSATSWGEMIKAADAAYKPGRFTTFAGFEWTSNPDKRNLHRVVVFRDTVKLPGLPLSALTNDDPETLWKWMEAQRSAGSTLLAIPHNGNASDGRMFELKRFNGQPLDAAYNRTRAKNEPLYEISQIKGTSETHPDLSPNDEFAGFEQWDYTLSADYERPTKRRGSFARQALLDGMSQAAAGKGNPFKYGFIGDTDTHNAAASNEEFNYTGKFAFENIPKVGLYGLPGMPAGQVKQLQEFSSAGLAGVWAEKNTRGAIFDAMQRKETWGTSGTMIKVRFFGGWDFAPGDVNGPGFVKAGYARGVPMGGDLKGKGQAPTFMVMAQKDPKSGNLDRVQIVKGWLDASGKQHEQVYDVVWSGARKPGANGKVPAVGNTVDPKTATYTNSIGAPMLATVWKDPAFDPNQRAFYYARVLEIPTPRWSTRHAVELGLPIPAGLPVSLQERAWTSPIWYTPG